jgi:23S rRNA (cytosine1962-C5)-methyltransferase
MRIDVTEKAAKSVQRGHPWVYRDAIVSAPKKLETGAVVDVHGAGAFVGRGIFDASSPIAARVYVRDPNEPLDAKRLAGGIERAWEKRARAFDAATTAYRAVNGEGDRVPGVVLDRYAHVAVLRLDGGGIAAWLDELAPLVARLAAERGVRSLLLRLPRDEAASGNAAPGNAAPGNAAPGKGGDSKVRVLAGPEISEPVDVLEHGMKLEVDVVHGQKTGAFLDQRENRRRVRELVRPGDRVLNLFSYTGGFSVAAAVSGASRVTSVDVATKAHATAQRIFTKNGVDPKAHAFVTSDATKYVDDLAKRGERFELVISDPPSFAPNERSKARGMAAYANLHRGAARLLAPGGALCLASCSSHVSMDDFFRTMDDEALGRSDLSVERAYGPPDDHPSVPAFPEGRYLKFVVLR